MSGKPMGLQIGVGENGAYMRVAPMDHVADQVWDAVREAVASGWTVEKFRDECREAWVQAVKGQLESDKKAWDR